MMLAGLNLFLLAATTLLRPASGLIALAGMIFFLMSTRYVPRSSNAMRLL